MLVGCGVLVGRGVHGHLPTTPDCYLTATSS